MTDLKCDLDWYIEHQSELVPKYNGRVLIIRDRAVVGDFADEVAAILAARRAYEPGTYLIQKCTPGDSAYTQTFHSRVRI